MATLSIPALKGKVFREFSINIDQEIKSITITLRQKYSLKLPDAIICATAMIHKLTLVTNDLKLHKISEINCCHLEDITE